MDPQKRKCNIACCSLVFRALWCRLDSQKPNGTGCNRVTKREMNFCFISFLSSGCTLPRRYDPRPRQARENGPLQKCCSKREIALEFRHSCIFSSSSFGGFLFRQAQKTWLFFLWMEMVCFSKCGDLSTTFKHIAEIPFSFVSGVGAGSARCTIVTPRPVREPHDFRSPNTKQSHKSWFRMLRPHKHANTVEKVWSSFISFYRRTKKVSLCVEPQTSVMLRFSPCGGWDAWLLRWCDRAALSAATGPIHGPLPDRSGSRRCVGAGCTGHAGTAVCFRRKPNRDCRCRLEI